MPKDFSKPLADPDDAVDGKVYGGPIARHDAEETRKGMDDPDAYKLVKVRGSGGSLTALPIIETLLGDVSAYVPTNVISITDGQIYLAINAGLSVSRVGGDAQTRAMKQVAGGLRLDMAAFRELAAFALFSSDLDKATQAQLNRGQRLQEILKQPQYEPVSLENEVVAIFAGTNGYTDKIPVSRIKAWESAALRYMETSHSDLLREIAEEKEISKENEARLQAAIEAFNSTWQ